MAHDMQRNRERGTPGGGAESGASAVTVAILLMVVGGFLALVMNVGHLMAVRNQLQNATDSGALAGAAELDGTIAGLARAKASAADFARRHVTDRDVAMHIDPSSDVILGSWDWSQPRASAFTAISESTPNAERLINAVLVKSGREEARSNPLEVIFPVFTNDQQHAGARAESVAVGGGPAEDCSVPFVFADCIVLKDDGSVACDADLILRNDSADNMGFTNLTDGLRSVNTADIIDSFTNCRHVEVGDEIGVSNGNNLNNHVVNAVEQFRRLNGSVVSVPIVSSPEGCDGTAFKFNGMLSVVGFVSIEITAVEGPPTPAVHIEIKCQMTNEESRSGGGFFGTKVPEPGLVR